MPEPVALSIVLPCLNEVETLAACIQKAHLGMKLAGLSGEVVVADNGSTDGSQALAAELGARVVAVPEKGYGNALRGGIEAARAPWILLGDSDDSYDFSQIAGFIAKLKEGYDLVMGCRLPGGGGTILPGAMPWKNRWLGNPALSWIGRVFFHCPVRDFHCGLRALTRAAYDRMELKTSGMEFASEMVIKATLKSLRVAEVPITLYPDGRSRPPHLKPWRDGWKHLRFMLIYSPRWLFFVPGFLLVSLGLLGGVPLAVAPQHLGQVQFNVGTLAVACMGLIIGLQLLAFAFFTKVFAIGEGLLPHDPKFARLFSVFSLEKGILAGLLAALLGLGLLVKGVWVWHQVGYGLLSPAENMRRLLPAVTLVVVGIQITFSSFFMSVLGLRTTSRRPPAT